MSSIEILYVFMLTLHGLLSLLILMIRHVNADGQLKKLCLYFMRVPVNYRCLLIQYNSF